MILLLSSTYTSLHFNKLYKKCEKKVSGKSQFASGLIFVLLKEVNILGGTLVVFLCLFSTQGPLTFAQPVL